MHSFNASLIQNMALTYSFLNTSAAGLYVWVFVSGFGVMFAGITRVALFNALIAPLSDHVNSHFTQEVSFSGLWKKKYLPELLFIVYVVVKHWWR